MTDQTKLKFVPVDLSVMQDNGVLMAANEAFFWPFGLALTWTPDVETGEAGSLHIRQWDWDDGEQERIDLDAVDPAGEERRKAFAQWMERRFLSMKPDEAIEAKRRLYGRAAFHRMLLEELRPYLETAAKRSDRRAPQEILDDLREAIG